MLMKSAFINEVHVLTMYRGMVNWVDGYQSYRDIQMSRNCVISELNCGTLS